MHSSFSCSSFSIFVSCSSSVGCYLSSYSLSFVPASRVDLFYYSPTDRSPQGHCLGISCRCVSRTHHSHSGHYDQVTFFVAAGLLVSVQFCLLLGRKKKDLNFLTCFAGGWSLSSHSHGLFALFQWRQPSLAYGFIILSVCFHSKNMHRVDMESGEVAHKVKPISLKLNFPLKVKVKDWSKWSLVLFYPCFCDCSGHQWQLTPCFMSQPSRPYQWGRTGWLTYRYTIFTGMSQKKKTYCT